jgi:hypothetical protein
MTQISGRLGGPRTSQQLRAELDDASVGQLYHHLRELLAVGLITQPARSQYAIPKGSGSIALCIQIIAASRLVSNTPRLLPPDEEPPRKPSREPRNRAEPAHGLVQIRPPHRCPDGACSFDPDLSVVTR